MPLDQELSAIQYQPWWWQDAHPIDQGDALPAETDVVVIGSGYAGLSCALYLARAGTAVTVIDALAIGAGASSRAAGFLSGRSGVSKQINLTAMVGGERAAAILSEADTAYEHLQDRLTSEEIDCDFTHCGRFVGAHTPKAYQKIAVKCAEYNSDGSDGHAMIPPDQQGDYVQSPLYYGGMLIRNAGTLHPAKYHAGLVRLCRAAGVRLVPHTRMTGVVREGQGFRVITDKGDISAMHAALGTNGYTDAGAPWHMRRIIPISSTIIATEPLGRDVVDRLLPAGCPVIDTKRVLDFARPTPDRQAILFGGRASFMDISDAAKARILRRKLAGMFPELADVGLTHCWGGRMGFTFDFLPKLGVQDGVHYAVGCNGGSGIVMMSWLGRQMAGQILGTANRPSAFQGLPFKTQPLYAGKPWFLPFVGNWYRLRDWLEVRGNPKTG